MIGLQWGVVGVAAAYAIANLILAYPTFSIPFRLIDLRVRDLGLALWRPLLSSLLMMIAVFSLRTVLLLLDIANSLTLVVLITTGIIVYLTASWMLNRAQVREILDIVGIKI
jgi:PST family polysaccharide transporter